MINVVLLVAAVISDTAGVLGGIIFGDSIFNMVGAMSMFMSVIGACVIADTCYLTITT